MLRCFAFPTPLCPLLITILLAYRQYLWTSFLISWGKLVTGKSSVPNPNANQSFCYRFLGTTLVCNPDEMVSLTGLVSYSWPSYFFSQTAYQAKFNFLVRYISHHLIRNLQFTWIQCTRTRYVIIWFENGENKNPNCKLKIFFVICYYI